jgi:hypothetical protein
MIHLNAFTQCSICPQSKGQWKHPLDRSSVGYRDLDYYAEIARTLERGRFDAFFFADIHGTYDAFRGARDAAVQHAVQFPCNDPPVLLPALAMVTRHLGFAATYSTTYHPPYQAAKLFSTLDHLTRGRIGWNGVTSYLPDSEKFCRTTSATTAPMSTWKLCTSFGSKAGKRMRSCATARATCIPTRPGFMRSGTRENTSMFSARICANLPRSAPR